MAVREIIQLGDKRLKTKCEYVKKIDDEVIQIINDLKETLETVDGIGLAAPQIGVTKRIVYINFGDGENEYVLINPVITKKRGKIMGEEGCLSYVGFEGLVERPKIVKIQYTDMKGKKNIIETDGLLARCFCHEIDHLDGIMYVDKAKEMYELEFEDDVEDEEVEVQ